MSPTDQLSAAMRRLAKEEPARYFAIKFSSYAGWWGLLSTAWASVGLFGWGNNALIQLLSIFGFAGLMTVWNLAEMRSDS